MTAKLIPIASLLLLLANPALAAPAESTAQAPVLARQEQPSQQASPQPQPAQHLAWQRVGAPLSLET